MKSIIRGTVIVLLLNLIIVSSAMAYPSLIWRTGQTGVSDQKGVEWPSPRFTDNNDGTITDTLTNLMWLKNTNCFGTMIWPNAMLKVSNFNTNNYTSVCNGYYANYNDWRMPNRKELFSLIDRSKSDPALPQDHPFMNNILAIIGHLQPIPMTRL